MISLTRLSGSEFLLNSDLIERVDSTPDTVITLVDGKKYVVAETVRQVLEAVLSYRGEIVAVGPLLSSSTTFAARVQPEPEVHAPDLHLAPVATHPPARGLDGLPHEREM